MGALYEDVEKFFGDIFAFYGKFLARYPVVFILLTLFTSSLLGMGLLNLRYETHVDKLYTPMGSPALKDQARLAKLFPERTSKSFYTHQQLFLDTYGSILIIRHPPLGEQEGEEEEEDTPRAGSYNVLTQDVVGDVLRLYKLIEAITLEKDDQGFKYEDLCASRNGHCVIDGKILLAELATNSCLSTNHTFPYIYSSGGEGEDLTTVLSGIKYINSCMTAQAFRLKFNLRHDTPRQRDLGLLWEMKFLQEVKAFRSDHALITYSVSESLDIELTENVGEDTRFFGITVLILVIYATFVSSGGNWVSTRVLLAQAGLIAALLAILASFGLLSMCGMAFVDICGVMPFLVLGVGVDDMFILMSGWRQTDVKKDIEERISETFRSSAISITITSLTDLLAFCIGATSPFLSVKNFCVYTGVAVLLCYINQITFFGGCLVLHARRVQASRHTLTCLRTSSRVAMVQEGYSRGSQVCCSGHPPERVGEDDSLCEKIPSSFLPRMLLKGPVKLLVLVSFIIYISVSVWGASNIKTGLKLENVVPEHSYLHNFIQQEQQHFPERGAHIMFVVENPVRYSDLEVHEELNNVFSKAMKSGFLDANFRISWLESYLEYRRNHSYQNPRNNFIGVLRNDFLPQHQQFLNDIRFNEDGTEIIASRFYIKSMLFQESEAEGDLMLKMREIAENSTLPLIAYGPEFIYYEHYVSILKNTLLAVGVAVLGMLFVALMFIPHPVAITCVTVSMVTIVLGMFGFMHFWGLALSAITTVQIILSVGFCVDFTVHISHAFMTATGKNRNERVMAALEKVGVPILNGAVSSILGIFMLAFASSYIFKSFFKTMLMVIVLGVAHSLIFLPVILSFVGPRRTNKPRVFIPINCPQSPGGRILNEMMNDYNIGQDPPHGPGQCPGHGHAPPLNYQTPSLCTHSPHAPPSLSPHSPHPPSQGKDGYEHIELLSLDVPQRDSSTPSLLTVPQDNPTHPPSDVPRDNSAPAMLNLADIGMIDKEAQQPGSAPCTETRPSTLPRVHRVVIERPPMEDIRLSQYIPRPERTPSPLLSKPRVDKSKKDKGDSERSWVPFRNRDKHNKHEKKEEKDGGHS